MKRLCQVCGIDFLSFDRTSVCSDVCRKERSRRHTAKYEAKSRENRLVLKGKWTCVVCKKAIPVTRRSNAITCSCECARRHQRSSTIMWHRQRASDPEYKRKRKVLTDDWRAKNLERSRKYYRERARSERLFLSAMKELGLFKTEDKR